MAPPTRTIVADRGDAGVRLDRVLRRHLADLDAATRTRVQAWIEAGRVTVNGAAVRRVSTRAALGDRLCVMLPEPKPRRTMAAEETALDVLFEDEHLLALNKPPGIVVHPAYRHATGTLMNALLGRARTWPAGRRPSIVGRLDKGTSGIVLVAKTAAIHAALQRALSPASLARAVTRPPYPPPLPPLPPLPAPPALPALPAPPALPALPALPAKEYLAIVYGKPPQRGTIDVRLRLDPRDRRRVVASTDDGAASLTRFQRVARIAAPTVGVALLRCHLVTGRRHQVRVHLSAQGWPIVGDPTYGEPRWGRVGDARLAAALQAFPRQALHAWRLTLDHPVTGETMRIEAPVPADMRDLMAQAGLRLRP
jgi:23S rRNA pseudouridine1911/1915/1917 synthase